MLFQPRRLSYSRHAVDDKHIELGHPINYKVHMQVRRMVSENRLRRRKHHHHNNTANGPRVRPILKFRRVGLIEFLEENDIFEDDFWDLEIFTHLKKNEILKNFRPLPIPTTLNFSLTPTLPQRFLAMLVNSKMTQQDLLKHQGNHSCTKVETQAVGVSEVYSYII